MSTQNSRFRKCITAGLCWAVVCAIGFSAHARKSKQEYDAEVKRIQTAIQKDKLSWKAGHTDIGAMSDDEFRGMLIDYDAAVKDVQERFKGREGNFPEVNFPISTPRIDVTAPQFNWRDVNGENWLSPIANQGACGSCTCFAAIGAVEGGFNLAMGNPDEDKDLCEQYVLSCSSTTCSQGGMTPSSLDIAQDTGVPLEACYPYPAKDGDCNSVCSGAEFDDGKVMVTDYGSAGQGDAGIKEALRYGPAPTGTLGTDPDGLGRGSRIRTKKPGNLCC